MWGKTTTTNTRKVPNILKVLIIGILVVLATRVPFLHKQYEYVNSIHSIEYTTHKATYKPIIRKRDSSLELLLINLENGTISTEAYIESVKAVKKESILALKKFNIKKTNLKNNYRYKGFLSYSLFLFTIGTPIMTIVLCLLFFYIIMSPVTSNSKKIVFSIYGSLFLFTATYFVLHAFYAEQVYNGDFPKNWYKNIMRYVPVLISLTIPLLFYHYQTVEEKLKSIINKLIVFIRKSEDEYIDSKEKKKKHFEDSFDLYEEIVED